MANQGRTELDTARPLTETDTPFPDAPLTYSLRADAIACLLLAIGMILWQSHTFLLPPYQDQAAGYWTEADFLANTSFDYYALRYEVNHYMDLPPGPRSYMISVIPTMLAALTYLVPNVSAQIVIVRTATFLCGALIVLILYRLLRSSIGTWEALLTCAAYVTLPLFIVQLEIMGMDVPLTPPMLLAVIALMRDRFITSAGWALIAFFMKATGQLVTLVALTYLPLLLILGFRQMPRALKWRCAFGVVVHSLVLLFQILLIGWGDTSVAILAGYSWPVPLKPPYSIVTLTPELGVLIVFAAILTGWCLWREWRHRTEEMSLYTLVRDRRVLVLSWIAVAGLLASSTLFVYMPRYVFCVVPFVYLITGMLLFEGKSSRYWRAIPLLALIAFNLSNQQGQHYLSIRHFGASDFERIPSLTPRLCMFSERSHEYLSDHYSNLAVSRLVESLDPQIPVFAPVPYLFFFNKPAAGYVTKQLAVNDATTFDSAIHTFCELYGPQANPPPPPPVFILYGDSRISVPLPSDEDEIIYADGLDPQVLGYRVVIPEKARQSREQLEEWYLDRSWSLEWPLERIKTRASFLFRTGRLDRLQKELNAVLQIHPEDISLLYLQTQLELHKQAGSEKRVEGQERVE